MKTLTARACSTHVCCIRSRSDRSLILPAHGITQQGAGTAGISELSHVTQLTACSFPTPEPLVRIAFSFVLYTAFFPQASEVSQALGSRRNLEQVVCYLFYIRKYSFLQNSRRVP